MKFAIAHANQINYFRLSGSQKMVSQNCEKSYALRITQGVLYLFLIS